MRLRHRTHRRADHGRSEEARARQRPAQGDVANNFLCNRREWKYRTSEPRGRYCSRPVGPHRACASSKVKQLQLHADLVGGFQRGFLLRQHPHPLKRPFQVLAANVVVESSTDTTVVVLDIGAQSKLLVLEFREWLHLDSVQIVGAFNKPVVLLVKRDEPVGTVVVEELELAAQFVARMHCPDRRARLADAPWYEPCASNPASSPRIFFLPKALPAKVYPVSLSKKSY
jgi:hypothetical protein